MRAIDCAARFVRPDGLMLLALYRRTLMCPFWTREKRWFTHGPDWYRALARALYRTAFVAGLLVTGRRPHRYFTEYRQNRGMDWSHDMEDWLGGYPYESTTYEEVGRFLTQRGFEVVKSKVWPRRLGLLGSGCGEYLFHRRAEAG